MQNPITDRLNSHDLPGNIPAYAAGKTVEAFKNNTYEGTSDCKKFVNGIKQQVPSYKSTLKQKTGISLKSFKGKNLYLFPLQELFHGNRKSLLPLYFLSWHLHISHDFYLLTIGSRQFLGVLSMVICLSLLGNIPNAPSKSYYQLFKFFLQFKFLSISLFIRVFVPYLLMI